MEDKSLQRSMKRVVSIKVRLAASIFQSADLKKKNIFKKSDSGSSPLCSTVVYHSGKVRPTTIGWINDLDREGSGGGGGGLRQ